MDPGRAGSTEKNVTTARAAVHVTVCGYGTVRHTKPACVMRGIGWRQGAWRDGVTYSFLRTDPPA